MHILTLLRNAAVALTVVTGTSFLASSADAVVILTFGQSTNANTVTGTANSPTVGRTTIMSTNTPVIISQIDASPPLATQISAFFSLNLVSTDQARRS